MVQVAVIGILAALLALQFRSEKPEFGIYIALAATVLLFFYAAGKLQSLIEGLEAIQTYLPLKSQYLTLLIKLVGVTYLSEFAAAICKDAGHQSIGSQIELFAKLSILALSMPVILTLFQTISGLLGG